MAFATNGDTVFRSSVSNTGEGTLSILALGSRKLVSTHSAGEGPNGIVVMRHC